MAQIIKIGKNYFTDFRHKGKRIRLSTKTGDRRVASRRMFQVLERFRTEAFVEKLSKNNIEKNDNWIISRWYTMNYKERQAVIFTRFQGLCFHCKEPVKIPETRDIKNKRRVVLDHLVPVSGGGPDSFENIVLSCHSCNTIKADNSF